MNIFEVDDETAHLPSAHDTVADKQLVHVLVDTERIAASVPAPTMVDRSQLLQRQQLAFEMQLALK